tara:strand:- start:5778 stop:6116 length:339 start_codon:yes stop_codon:yes gene_type:complete
VKHRGATTKMEYNKFVDEIKEFNGWQNEWSGTDVMLFGNKNEDMVNSPPHYTAGKQEVIDTIEDAIQDAPSVKKGMLQAQALKYLLRLWNKSNAKEDAKKAEWYLRRLIDSL